MDLFYIGVNSKNFTFYGTIVFYSVHEFDNLEFPVAWFLITNNKVKLQVCFAPHELDYKFPSSSNDQIKYGNILNSFTTFINHKDEYPFKIAKIQTEKYWKMLS